MLKQVLLPLTIAAGIRCYLGSIPYADVIGNRVEVATPLNSYKRVQEGIYLLENGIDPYSGDMVHETPLLLLTLAHIFSWATPQLIRLSYIALDLLTAVLLQQMAQHFVQQQLKKQKYSNNFAPGTEALQLQANDVQRISLFVLYAYLFNPLCICNCVGLTSTVFSNLLLALILLCLVKGWMLPCVLFLALESLRSLYTVVLISPVVLIFSQDSLRRAVHVVLLFFVSCAAISWLNMRLMGSWNYLDGTLGFIFFYRDLQPNIGLFWYFFTEMFEHFRTMFLITFQMNATVLYLLPLSLRLRREPMLLATILIMLAAIFRSYPAVGDVGFYLCLLPLWMRCWKFMAHNFIVLCFFLVTLCMMPALWHLWNYAGSANANFYFGTTLAFSTGQIFLCTDLLFAYIKREFCLKNGQKVLNDGKEAHIILE